MPDASIVAEGLERRFGDKVAVDGIDLEVRPGEIYGFLGPNGAGKSTTMKMLCTLLLPSGGRARVAGFDVATCPDDVRLRIGVALQEASLDPKQTGIEQLRLQGRLYGLSRRDVDRRLVDLAELTDLGEALDQQVGTYSGGMRRRLDLAAALVHDPEVLFLDEPTTGLDPVSRARVWDEVRRLNEDQGMTIFLTTQYLEEADALAHRVGIISDGRIAGEGPPEELKRRIGSDLIVVEVDGDAAAVCTSVADVPGVQSVQTHGGEVSISVADGDASLSPVVVALHECGVAVRNVSLRRPTLDDVFLELTGAHLREKEVA